MQNQNPTRGRPRKELPPHIPLHENLPQDLSSNFSQWFYKEILTKPPRSKFTKNHSATGQKESDVSPVRILNTIMVDKQPKTDHISFLTQDLHLTQDDEPISKLIDYKMTVKEKVRKPNEPNNSNSNNMDKNLTLLTVPNLDTHDGDPNSKKTLNEVKFTLNTRVTLIDRRPMLKLKRKATSNEHSPVVKKNTLIGPGEDCDGSDMEEIPEIDCDIIMAS